MIAITKEEIQDARNQYPETVRDILFAKSNNTAMRGTLNDATLNEEQIAAIIDETDIFLLGFISGPEFISRIAEKTKLPKEQARNIAEKIKDTVFLPCIKKLNELQENENADAYLKKTAPQYELLKTVPGAPVTAPPTQENKAAPPPPAPPKIATLENEKQIPGIKIHRSIEEKEEKPEEKKTETQKPIYITPHIQKEAPSPEPPAFTGKMGRMQEEQKPKEQSGEKKETFKKDSMVFSEKFIPPKKEHEKNTPEQRGIDPYREPIE